MNLRPANDLAFHAIFSDPTNKTILISLLNAVFEKQKERATIVDVEVEEARVSPENVANKLIV
jgi:PD-(D/E)XK nuclease family transposase